MNILVYFPDYKTNMGQWQKYHIFSELESHGHRIILFDPLLFENPDQANEALVTYVRKHEIKLDLFMNSLGSDELYYETVLEFKKAGIPTLLICFDNLHAPYMHKKTAPFFDLVWLTSVETKAMFTGWNCNVIFMPYAANPEKFRPRWDEELQGIGFIGMPYGTRINKINLLLRNEIYCHVYSDSVNTETLRIENQQSIIDSIRSSMNLIRFEIGRKVLYGALKKKITGKGETLMINSSFLQKLPSVSFEEMNYLYSNLSLSLGITELRNTYVLKKPVYKLHLRTFEIPMCGGLQLTSFSNELSRYFEDEKEIIMYRSNEEMISKAKFYLKPENRPLREKMKILAREKAVNEHSWICRYNKVFDALNLKR